MHQKGHSQTKLQIYSVLEEKNYNIDGLAIKFFIFKNIKD